MELKVKLGAEKFVGIKDRLNAGEETILVFESDEYPVNDMQVTITDGSFMRRHVVNGGRMNLSEYCKKAAVIEISADLVLRGEVAKTWLLEPIVVREVSGGYELIPEISLLRKEIRTMKKIIRELNSKIKDTM